MLTKLSSDKIKKIFPTYFTSDYIGKMNEYKIRIILNIYHSKKGGRTFIAKKIKVDQSVVGRILKIAIKNRIIKKVPPSDFKTKEKQRIYSDITERKIYKQVRPITLTDRKLNLSIPKNAKFKIQLPTGKHMPSTIVKYFVTIEEAEGAKKEN